MQGVGKEAVGQDSKSGLEMTKHDMEHQWKANKTAEEKQKEPMLLDQKLEKLFRELTDSQDSSEQLEKLPLSHSQLSKKEKVLADKLIELGIPRRVDDFIKDLFNPNELHQTLGDVAASGLSPLKSAKGLVEASYTSSLRPNVAPSRLTSLPPLKSEPTRARGHLTAAQYFEEHGIRAHVATLTQMLLVHQPKNPLRFMHNEIGRMLDSSPAEDSHRLPMDVNCLSGSGYSSVAEPASPQDEHISFHEFKNRVNAEREVSLHMAWLSKSEILRNIAQALSFRDGKSTAEEDATSRLRGLSNEELTEKVNAASQTVQKNLDTQLKKPPCSEHSNHTGEQSKKTETHGKFEVDESLFKDVDASRSTFTYGVLDDFKRGVSDRIGAPHPKVWEEIMREHRESGDSKTKFKPGNYDMNDGTTSEIEYAVVTDPKKGREVSIGTRKVKSLAELQDVRLAKEAKLIKDELIAISLYTGPMFYKYNAVLRDFPPAALETCNNLNGTYNKYPTTITALLSGLRKLMWVAPLPHDRFVYRGLGGMDLPETFFKQDRYGVRGGTEYGMMSTTRKIDVAIQYTGNKKMPTVFQIAIGAVNRGAVLKEFSQYPEEEEVLFPPFSYLEVVGEITYMPYTEVVGKTTRTVTVRVVPLQVIANLNSPLLEDLIGKRKKLYIDSFEYQANNLERELWDLIDREKTCSSSQLCWWRSYEDVKKANTEKVTVINEIVNQFKAVLNKHKIRDPRWYNDDGKYRSAVIDMLSMKENAMAVPFLTTAMYNEWKDKQKKLRQAQRMVFKERKKALRFGVSDDTKQAAALDLCKVHGIVAEQLEERNEMSETPLIKESAEGNVFAVELLLVAGANVHATNFIGFSALNQAAYFGEEKCVDILLAAKADPHVLDDYGGTPLVAAALNGELECIRILLKATNGLFFCDKDKEGKAVRTQTKYIDKGTKKGSTPLMKACQNGHSDCVRLLIFSGADTSAQNIEDKTAEDICWDQIETIKGQNSKNKQTVDFSEHEKCLEILMKTYDQIRAEDNDDKSSSDRSRKESHIKAFESHALGLNHEITELIKSNNKNKELEEAWRAKEAEGKSSNNSSPEDVEGPAVEGPAMCSMCQRHAVVVADAGEVGLTAAAGAEVEAKKKRERAALAAQRKLVKNREEVPNLVVDQFKEVLTKHKSKTHKWYNDDSKYRWAVSEMLHMKDSAMAVPLLTPTMFEEWSNKLGSLRQARRMVKKEALQALRELKEGSAEKQKRAFEICKESGIVVDYLEELNEMQETPLIREAADGGIRSVRLLLEAGADVHAKQQNPIAFGAINQAAYFGHHECIQVLLEFKADVNALDGHGGTPLVAAALNGEIECVRVLLAAKANVNTATKRGSTPLMKAAKSSHNQVVRMLIKAGADKDLKDENEKTAEQHAKDEVDKFAPAGADKHLEDENEKTAEQHSKDEVDKFAAPKIKSKTEGESKKNPRERDEKKENEKAKKKTPDQIRAEDCLSSLGKTPEQIRAEDWEKQKTTDSGRRDSHIKTFETLELALKRELEELIVKEKPEFCCERELDEFTRELEKFTLSQSELFTFRELAEFFASSRVNSLEEFTRELDKFTVRKVNLAQSDEFTCELENFTMSLEEVTCEIEKFTDEFKAQSKEEIVAKLAQSKEEIVANLANEFGILFEKHRRRDAEWYNDDAKYNSAQNEMMSMHRNAKAVPFLTMTMYQEWRNKQSFLRQADRMASFLRQADRMANRDRTRRVQNEENQSKRKQVALDICKAVGLVMEKLEERNEMSETPLIREAADGNTRNVHLLLEAGASIEAKQENVIGFTALNQAAYLGHKPVVKLLLRFGAQVDCIDAYGGTPLVAAALNGEFECVQVLIKGGANINHETTNGNTPLMKAAINGHVDCVKWLIIQGADIYKKNNTAQTAKDQAQESKKHAQKAATAAATAAEQLQQQPKEDQDSKIDEKNNKEQTANDQAKDHAQKAATAAEQLQQQPKKEQDSKERIKSKLTTNELIKLQQRYEKSIDNLTKVIRALDEGAKLIAKKNESGHHSFLEYLKDLDEKSRSQMKTELEGVNKKINEPLEGSDNGAMRVESWIEAAIGPKKATWSSAFLDK